MVTWDGDLHGEAKKRFSEQAEELLVRLQPVPPTMSGQPLPASLAHRPVGEPLSLGDVLGGEWVRKRTDPATGKCLELVIGLHNVGLGFDVEGLRLFNELVERVADHKDLRRVCGREYVEAHLTGWCRKSRLVRRSGPWCDALIEALRHDVAEYSTVVPLDGLAIDGPLRIGLVELDYFQPQYFEPLIAQFKEAGLPEATLAKAVSKYAKYHGRVYARFSCLAEEHHAADLALDATERLLACLRFFHPAALDVHAHCPLGRMGALSPHEAYWFSERDGRVASSSARIDKSGFLMVLTPPQLELVMRTGLRRVIELLSEENPTDLETRSMAAVELYSGGLVSTLVEHRLVHALVAVESLLLKDQNEPIQAHLAYRMAHLVGRSVEERVSVVADVRAAYAIRSSFVHHGQPAALEDVQLVNRALAACWCVIIEILNQRKVETKQDLLGMLDKRLLGEAS